MKNGTGRSLLIAVVSATGFAIAAVALVGSPAATAQAPPGMRTLASLSANWSCYYKSHNRWYDCPTRVVSGRYVLGAPIGEPTLSVAREFAVAVPGRLFVDGMARCAGCQQLLEEWQLQLQRWDGARWQAASLGLGNRIIKCTKWAEECHRPGSGGFVTVAAGRYRLAARTGYSRGEGGEFFTKTALELAAHLVPDNPAPWAQQQPAAGGGLAAEVEWVECARASGFSNGIGELVDCRGQGLWRVDSRGSNLGRLSQGDRFRFDDRLKTDREAFARIRLLDGSDASITLEPGTQLAIERPRQSETSIILFLGRVLSLVQNEATERVFRVRSANSILGVESATWATSHDPASGTTEVLVADGLVELGCAARPQALRIVRAGERARAEGDCTVCLDFPRQDEFARLGDLASHDPAGFGPTGGDTAAVGTYLGCFKDAGESQGTAGRDLDGESLWPSKLTPQLCISECAARGYRYAGLQWGRTCYCGASYGRFGKTEDCKTPCWGDASQICGGYYANSVYATGGGGGFDAPRTEPVPAVPLPAQPAHSVTLYRDAGFRGGSATFTTSVRRLNETPIGHDQASSVRVAPGCRATLYEHSDYRGRSVQVVGDLAELGSTPLGNDEAGSLRLECR